MFGLQEILIIVAIVLGVLFIPRMNARRQPQRAAEPKIRLSGKIRMAVILGFRRIQEKRVNVFRQSTN